MKKKPVATKEDVTIIDTPIDGVMVKFTFIGKTSQKDIKKAVMDTKSLMAAMRNAKKTGKVRYARKVRTA